MQSKFNAYLVTLIGILLVLPLIGVAALGDLTGGLIGWVIAIAVLIIGLAGIGKSSE